MVDFLTIATRSTKRGTVEIYPKFIIKKSSDLMIRGGDFYAIWCEDIGLWSTDEQDAIRIIDKELDKYADDNRASFDSTVRVMHMWDADSGVIDSWHKYCQKQLRDNYHMLDEKIIFSNDKANKKDYASKRLDYPLEVCDIPNYERLMSVLYEPEERQKIEWAIGSILTGDSKRIQKFIVLYGGPGTGKSTVLDIIQKLFKGYYSIFDAKALGSASSAFALEAFKTNPLVAIQHDGDLSRIEDNTRLNSLVSHEEMTVNEKHKSLYTSRFKCFLFMGTNKPVKITDSKSGLIRRLIDASPSGNKLSASEYKKIVKQIDFELGGIACHCIDIYNSEPDKYDDYVPINMMSASNDFYNFMLELYFTFKDEDSATLKQSWEMYKTYCDEANVGYPLPQRAFKEELKSYFNEYYDRYTYEDGTRVRSYYSGFKTDKFEDNSKKKTESKSQKEKSNLIEFKEQPSIFDKEMSGMDAQYATGENDIPQYKWEKVKTKLKDLDTSKVHYVKVPENHIVIDFDIRGKDGSKNYELNLQEASKWPKTYAEISKGGSGIHLHYIYTGDPKKLSRVYDDCIEIKVFTGNSSLRRKLTKCNDIPIAKISSGLPLKGENKLINFEAVKSEKALRTLIKRNLNKEIHPATKPSIDFIDKILKDAYDSGLKYDVTDLRPQVLQFAAQSTHQSQYCIKVASNMEFKSEEASDASKNNDAPIVFYDVEVFPNLFVVNWKRLGDTNSVVRMINPKPSEIEELLQFRLVGYNCRRYDNHIMYGRLMGYSNEQLFKLSQRIVAGDQHAFFSEAYNMSFTDIYDYAVTKQSLKKWEIQLGIHHQELGLPWDKPVPVELWPKVAEYCDNDVIATEAVWNATQADFSARKIQVALVKQLHGIDNVTVNDTTNSLSTKIIFGKNRAPQSEFNYRDLSEPVPYTQYGEYRKKFGMDFTFRIFDDQGLPTYETYDGTGALPDGYSIMPFFPGYEFKFGKSTYLDQEIGEGGRVYAEPGMYFNVWDGDVASMHPHSIIFEQLFGPEYTKRFEDIVKARVAIKHKDFELAGSLLDGALKPFLDIDQAPGLAQALKIVINSIYGLTSARFTNAFKDDRNIDNIVAKRGALFMTLLKREVQAKGYTVAHIKTDSIKIPNATPEIIKFVQDFGKEYGYTFETEADFDRFCIVNDAVYVAHDIQGNWHTTGTQFQVPYVRKKLFTREPITFEDLCEAKAVTSALYLDMNEGYPDVTNYELIKSLRIKSRNSGEDSLTNKERRLLSEYFDISDEDLDKKIAEGHNYKFIGKTGLFCPMKPGCGAGVLLREKDGNYYSATGAKGYLWMESEMVKVLEYQDKIDKSYYDNLVNVAIDTISEYGDFEQFRSIDIPQGIVSDPLPQSFNLNKGE